MDKMIEIIKREYQTRVKKKSFIIVTLAVPVILICMVALVILLTVKSEDKPKHIVLVDKSGLVADSLIAEFSKYKRSDGQYLYSVEEWKIEGNRIVTSGGFINVEPGQETEVSAPKKAIMDKVQAGEFDGFVYLDEDAPYTYNADYYTKQVTGLGVNENITGIISRVFRHWNAEQVGLSQENMSRILNWVNLNIKRPVVTEEGKEMVEKGQSFGIAYILIFVLYMTTLLFGVSVQRSVLEEKTTRIIEVIVSSVKPFYIMMGKIIGVGTVCLTQFFIWAVSMYVIFLVSGPVTEALDVPFDKTQFTQYFDVYIPILIYFVVFFVLGFFQFATLYAGVGAIANSDEEANQMQFPVIMLAVIPYIFMTLVLKAPASTFAVVLSLIPGFVPMLMFMRICILTPPFIEILSGILIQIIFTTLAIWIVAKIYRVGILMYGKKPKVKELIKWLRYS